MGKMMSLLEKYKLVEKDATTDHLETYPVQSEVNESTLQNFPDIPDHTQLEEHLIQETDVPDTNENALPSSTSISNDMFTSEKTTLESQNLYHELKNLDEIYHSYQLDGMPITQTAYHLENLIQALPNELPDYVKKTTVNNIITASAIDMQTLLNDGMTRYNTLEAFLEAFTAVNMEEISTLKQEIEKLSAIITGYHQEIKLKETLIQEEAKTIEAEKARLSSILTFFKN